jgi:hypothetical protein
MVVDSLQLHKVVINLLRRLLRPLTESSTVLEAADMADITHILDRATMRMQDRIKIRLTPLNLLVKVARWSY